MAAPHTPQLSVEVGFGASPTDDIVTWVDVTGDTQADVTISRGRPSEFDRYKPGSLSLRLTDTTRDLDPTNLSGAYVESHTVETFPAMSAPSEEVGTSLGTDNTVTVPTHQTGDLLLAFVAVDQNGSATGVSTGTGSAVWTELFDTITGHGNVCRLACYARIATGSDALVLSGASQDYVVSVVSVVNHGCATTADIQVGTAATNSTGSADPPSLNAGADKKWLWVAATAIDLVLSVTINTPPDQWTAVTLTESANSNDSVALGVAVLEQQATTVDPGTFDDSNGARSWVANTLAVPPLAVTADRTQIVPNVPIRVVATMPSRQEVLNDTAAAPPMHSAWRLDEGSIHTLIAGDYVLQPGTVMRGPAYNWNGASTFQFGTSVDGASPDHDVRIVLANGGYIGWNLTGVNLTYAVNDGASTADDVVLWNDTTMRYLRIRISSDNVNFERSADASSWTNIDTYTRGTDFANTVDWSYGYLYVRNQATTTPELDDFKVEVSKFTLFTGTVDSWQYQPLPGKAAGIVHVSASDAFARFARTALPSIWETEMESHSPEVWYQLAEKFQGVGSIPAHDSSGHGRHGLYPFIGVGRSEPLTPLIGSGGAWFPPKWADAGIKVPNSARVPDDGDFTFNCWVQATERFPVQGASQFGNLAAMIFFTQAALDGDNNILRLWVQARDDLDETDPNNPVITHWVLGVYAVGDWGAYIADFEATIEDALPHMITWSVSSAGALAMYVDAVRVPVYHEYAGFAGSLQGTYIGNDVPAFGTPNGYAFPGAVDEVAWFPSVLTAAQVSALYEAATRPWDLDTTGERIHRVLDLIGWPENLRLIDNGDLTLGPADVTGQDVLSYLQAIEATEGGRLFIGPHGEVVFHDAARVVEQGTAPPLFDTAGSGVDLLADGFTVTADDSFLYTTASVSRDGGDEQTYQDPVAVARWGHRNYSTSTMARTDNEAYMRAAGIVERYKDPTPRLGGWQVAPQKDPALWPDVLDLRLGDTVQLTFQLLGTGDTYNELLDLAELSLRVSGGGWTYQLAATPQHPNIGAFFTWQTDGQGWSLAPWR